MSRPPGRPRVRRSSRLPRPGWAGRALGRPLLGREWSAGGGLGPANGRRRLRAAALALAVLEVALIVFLYAGGAFRVRHVEVTGNQRLTVGEVRRLAGLERPGSVFAVDADSIRGRLTRAAWIRDARVTAKLPDRVDLEVEEWQPVAVFAPGPRLRGYYLSDQAVVLGPAPSPDAALEIDAPAAPEPRAGQRPVDIRLLTALVNIARVLPGLVGQDVRSFEIDGCGNLTMLTRRGWRAHFGRVITPEEFASLDSKVAALKALSGAENLDGPDVEYVNLMNPSLPAVGRRPKPAPAPTPGRTTSPAPAASASPIPSPSPSASSQVPACR